VARAQLRAVGQLDGHPVVVLAQLGQFAAAPDLGAEFGGVLGQQAVGGGLRDAEDVRMCGVQPVGPPPATITSIMKTPIRQGCIAAAAPRSSAARTPAPPRRCLQRSFRTLRFRGGRVAGPRRQMAGAGGGAAFLGRGKELLRLA